MSLPVFISIQKINIVPPNVRGQCTLRRAMRHITNHQPPIERGQGLMFWTDQADADAVMLLALFERGFLGGSNAQIQSA